MTLKGRLSLLVCAALAGFVLLSVLSLTWLAQMADALERAYGDHLLPIHFAGQSLMQTADNRSELLLALNHSKNSPSRLLHDHPLSLHLDRIREARDVMDSLDAEISARRLSPETRRLFSQYVEARNRYRLLATNPTIDALNKGNFDFANLVLITKGNAEFPVLKQAMLDFSSGILADARENNEEAKVAIDIIKWAIVAITVLELLVLSVLAWKIVSYVLDRIGGEPEYALELANRVAEGDLDVDFLKEEGNSALSAIRGLAGGLRSLIGDIERVSASHESGQLDERLNQEKYQGYFKTLVNIFNASLDALDERIHLERQAKDQLIVQEQKFRTLAENSPDIIARYDIAGCLMYGNTAYMLEMDSDGKGLIYESNCKPTFWRPSITWDDYREHLLRTIRTGNPERAYWTWADANGKRVTYEVSIVAERNFGNTVTGALAIARNITERYSFEEKLLYQAQHDDLTGLPNRLLLKDRMQHAILRAGRNGERIAVVFVDLDEFKQVNDSMGHEKGDELLKIVSSRLSGVLRESDTIARIGGDEFVILVERVSDDGDIEVVVEKLLEAVSEPCQLMGNLLHQTASAGIAVFPDDGTDIETLMRHADTAMYVAKDDARCHYRFFSERMNEELQEWVRINSRLRQTIRAGGFSLHYQPKVSLADGKIVGLEALLRWQDPELGFVPPSKFIPLAEKYGFIDQIGSWVLDEACRQIQLWLHEGMSPPRVAINLSASQRQGNEMSAAIERALKRYDLEGRYLEVEITESILMADAEDSTRAFWQLQNMGIEVAVDDFGTGYSSLSYLKRLPVNKLKIDKSFIDDIESGGADAEIVRAIVAMAHSLDLVVVAEGVENSAQMDILRDAGCDQVQGYFYSRPLPAAEIGELLRKFATL